MTIAYLGSSVLDAGAGNGSSSGVTIPSGATLAVITCSAWDTSASGTPLANVVVDGQNDTNVISQDVGGGDENSLYLGWAKNFSTGASKTVSWTWTADEAIDEGARIYITWWSGVDLTTPFADSDFARGNFGDAIQVASLTTPEGSVVVVHAVSLSAPEVQADGSPTINSVYNDSTYQSQVSDVDYFARTQATHTIDMTGENYAAMVAVVLAEGAAPPVGTPKGVFGLALNGPLGGPLG